MNYEELKQKATEIRDETRYAQNTAQRVGSLLLEMVNHEEAQVGNLEVELDKRVTDEALSEGLSFVKDLGIVSTSGVAENTAISLASEQNLRMIHYVTENGQVGTIRQVYSNMGHTMQFLTLNGVEYVRVVYYDSDMKSPWRRIDNASIVYKLMYDAGARRLEFHDPIQDAGFGGITLPEATTGVSGLMSALDKQTLGRIVYLGMFSDSATAETKATEYASDRSKIILVYDLENGQNGVIEQCFSNTSATIQYLYIDGSRYVREVRWGIGTVGEWKNVTGSERISGLLFDSSTRELSFTDALGDKAWGSATLPEASTQRSGLMTASDKTALETIRTTTLPNISTALELLERIFNERVQIAMIPAQWVAGIEDGTYELPLTSATRDFTVVYLQEMGCFLAKGTDGTYYPNWSANGVYNNASAYGEQGGEFSGAPKPIAGRLYVMNGAFYTWNGVHLERITPTVQPTGTSASGNSGEFVYKGTTVGASNMSTDVLADVNITTNQNAINIVGKSWGTSNWQQRCSLTAATSGKAGVMSATQCTEHEELVNFLSKLKTALGTTDLDTIVNSLTE